jgi:hypothetical protein
MDNTYMYHLISSIGGYSPAKIRIYQEMIDSFKLYPPKLPINMNILNMLNTKYIIVPGRMPEGNLSLVNVDEAKTRLTYLNPDCLPRAYFVDSVIVATSKAETFLHMKSPTWNSKTTAIIEKRLGVSIAKSDSTSVNVKKYSSREISIETYSTSTSLLVVSETYYPAGWKAYVDGSETEIYKTNYVLRSVSVPAGNHMIEFRFDPPLYMLGLIISNTSWGLIFVLFIVGMFKTPGVMKKLNIRERKFVSKVVS